MWQIKLEKLSRIIVSGCVAFAVGLPMAAGSPIAVPSLPVQDESIGGQRILRWEGLENRQPLHMPHIGRIPTINQLIQIEDQFEITSSDTLATSIILRPNSSFSLSANGVTRSFEPDSDRRGIQFESLFGSAVSSFTLYRTVFLEEMTGPFVISPYLPVQLTFNQTNADLQLIRTVTSIVPEPSTIGLAVLASIFFVRRSAIR